MNNDYFCCRDVGVYPEGLFKRAVLGHQLTHLALPHVALDLHVGQALAHLAILVRHHLERDDAPLRVRVLRHQLGVLGAQRLHLAHHRLELVAICLARSFALLQLFVLTLQVVLLSNSNIQKQGNHSIKNQPILVSNGKRDFLFAKYVGSISMICNP